MMNEDRTIPITRELYDELITSYASVKALERYVMLERYDVSRKKIAAILGFELKDEKENADV